MFKPMLKIEDAKTAKDAMELVEQVLDTIGEYGNGVSDDDIIGAYSKLIKARDLLDEEFDWISVEERFPEEGESVLVSFRGSGFQPVIAFISESGRWLMLQGAKGYNDITNDVIAWCPLPEPYRPERSRE